MSVGFSGGSMKKVMVIGTGKVGSLISVLLLESKAYDVCIVDSNLEHPNAIKLLSLYPKIPLKSLDVTQLKPLQDYMQECQIDAVISALPYFLNEYIAQSARKIGVHYFDLTEDVQTTNKIKLLARQSTHAFIPQCGVAPGFINIITEYLMSFFDECHEVKLRVGGLPQYIDNAFKYGLTWSLDGLINQYSNLCPAIEDRKIVMLEPLDDLEKLMLGGCEYEAFTTSGGSGHLVETKAGRVNYLNYKTIRYPGHCEKIRFLMHDLQLKNDKPTLLKILNQCLPRVVDDLLILYASVTGYKDGHYDEKHYFHQIYPHQFQGLYWTAMQTATASSACAVIDMILNDPVSPKGLILHERFDFNFFLENRFATCFR